MFQSLSPIIVAFLTGVAGPVLIVLVKNYLDKKKKPADMVEKALEVSKLVTDKIEHIKDEFKADRVWVAQFHNGGHFYPTGRSIAKFSIFYETVNSGVSSIQSNFQNIPVNLFSKSINELLENDIIEISDFKDEKIATFGLKYIAEEHGCKSGYFFAIKTIDGKFIGYLGIGYTKRKHKLDIESINHISNHAAAMGGVLMTDLNQ
jgi:AAA+ ATPase superfamily predicted ATPase